MALNLESIGKRIGPLIKEYTERDCILYALGVGAGFEDLEYAYEKDLKVIPTFGIAAIFEFLAEAGTAANIDLSGVLHGEQEMIFYNPIPPSGKLITVGKISGIYDKGKDKGAIVIAEADTYSERGKKLFKSIATIFARRDGGFGGKDRPTPPFEWPDREPDFVERVTPSPNQPLLYRLSGDLFPLHADPEFAQMAGFEKPIMHGLCTYGYACRAVIKHIVPGQPEKLRRFAGRFSRPLYPGQTVEIQIWKTGDGTGVYKVVNAETGEVVIDRGVFEYGELRLPEIRFDGKVAVVTGAGGGLGRIYAIELAKRGAKVVVNDAGVTRDGSKRLEEHPADKVVSEIRDMGGEAVANYDSVATPKGGMGVIETALANYGRVDILINNAGILRDKSLAKMSSEQWEAVRSVHLDGAFYVTKHAFAQMKKQGYGRIIVTTSAAGLYGNFGQTNYSAAKMGLIGFMNSLKLEGERYNIKINAVAPLAASRLTEDVLPPELFEKLAPEYVAPLVLYLCSERCETSGHIYNAGMGHYSRAAVWTGRGVSLGGSQLPTPEDIAKNWSKLSDISDGKIISSLTEFIASIPQDEE